MAKQIAISICLVIIFVGSLIFNIFVPVKYVGPTVPPKQSTISTQSQAATPASTPTSTQSQADTPASTPTSTPTSTTTPVSAEYYDTSKYCSGNTEENAFINAKSSTEFSTTRNEIDECRTLCSNTADCEMYLQSDSNTCLLYKDVKDVTMYCNSGSGHGYYGNVKIKNSLNPDNVVDESSIVPPTSTPTPAPTTATPVSSTTSTSASSTTSTSNTTTEAPDNSNNTNEQA